MKHAILGATLIAGAACHVGCTNDDTAAEAEPAQVGEGDRSLPGDPQAGAAVYEKACVACHGADGRANGGVTGADFVSDESRLAKSNEELLTAIRDGVDGNPPMPPQGPLLSEQEMKDALAYIRQQFGSTE